MSIEITDNELVHDGWSRYFVATIRMPNGQTIRREIEDHGRAVAVLPYDPARRTALLVRQFRAPVFVATQEPDLLEAIAGIVEAADAAEEARREAAEEAGVGLRTLEWVGAVWTSPGVSTERMDLYLAPYTERDRDGAGGGLAGEHEDIEVAEFRLAELARMADAGGIADMKTFALVQTLRLRRPELFTAQAR